MNKNTWTTALVLGGVATLGLLLTNMSVLDWNSASSGGATAHQNVWSAGGSFGGTSASTSIYDSAFNDEKGITMLRIGAPVYLVGLLGCALGLALLVMKRNAQASLTLLIATGLTVVATVLITIGWNQANGSGSGMNLALGFYATCAAIVCCGVAGFLTRQGTTAPAHHPTHARN